MHKAEMDQMMDKILKKTQEIKIEFQKSLQRHAEAHAKLRLEHHEKTKLFEHHMQMDPLP